MNCEYPEDITSVSLRTKDRFSYTVGIYTVFFGEKKADDYRNQLL